MELLRGKVGGEHPWALTLASFARNNATGQLTIYASDQSRYAIAFERGDIVAAASPLAPDSVARVAQTGRLASPAQIAEVARRLATLPGIDEVAEIAEVAQLSPAQVMQLQREVITRRAARTFALETGTYTFQDRITLALCGCRVDIRPVVYQGIRMHVSQSRLASELRPVATARFALIDSADQEIGRFGFCDGEAPVLDALRQTTTFAELEARQHDLDARTVHAAVYALLACGTARAQRPDVRPEPVVSRTITPQAVVSRTITPQPVVSRTITPQPVVSRTVTAQPTLPRTVTAHPTLPRTVTAQPTLPRTVTAQPTLPRTVTAQPTPSRTVTAQPSASTRTPARPATPITIVSLPLDLAPATGTPPMGVPARGARETMDRMTRTAATPPAIARTATTEQPAVARVASGSQPSIVPRTQVELAADAAAKAERALSADKPHEAIADLERACELAPDDAAYAALLGWAQFCTADNKKETADRSRRLLERGLATSHRAPQRASQLRMYLGRIERILGRDREALDHFHAVLELEPRHRDASAEIRVLERRLELR